MGLFYTNITVKQDDPKVVADAVARLKRDAVIAPPVKGFVMVYDLESENQDGTLPRLARQLSDVLRTVVLAVMNHDDDVLCYWLFESGQELDQYISCPLYFEASDDQGGDAEVLARTFGCESAQTEIDRVLHGDLEEINDSPFDAETGRHSMLVRILQTPDWAVGFGYKYLAKDELPEDFPADDTFYTLSD